LIRGRGELSLWSSFSMPPPRCRFGEGSPASSRRSSRILVEVHVARGPRVQRRTPAHSRRRRRTSAFCSRLHPPRRRVRVVMLGHSISSLRCSVMRRPGFRYIHCGHPWRGMLRPPHRLYRQPSRAAPSNLGGRSSRGLAPTHAMLASNATQPELDAHHDEARLSSGAPSPKSRLVVRPLSGTPRRAAARSARPGRTKDLGRHDHAREPRAGAG